MYYCFQTLFNFPCQLFLSRIKMVDQCGKPVNLGNFVFDEENQERKSWKLFQGTCNRSLLVFFVLVLMLVCAIVPNLLSTTCEKNNSLGSYLIECSRLYSTFSKAIKNILSTKQRTLISLVGPSGSGKTHLYF